jgi:hypothetical protein
MYARKVIPILLIAGGLMMFMRHKRLELMGQSEEGEQHRPMGLHGPRGDWGKRVPPMFDAEGGTSARMSRNRQRSNRSRSEGMALTASLRGGRADEAI